MKVRLDETGLIVTPESYVEQVALRVWSEQQDNCSGLLIDAYDENDSNQQVSSALSAD